MTRFGGGNFRQTYEGAVHTRNTYKNVALSIRTIRGSCPWPGADTRLGTKNLCEGTHCSSYTLLHKVQFSLKLKANCMLVLCTHPPVYVGLVPRERGDRWVLVPPPPVDTFVTNLPAISPRPRHPGKGWETPSQNIYSRSR